MHSVGWPPVADSAAAAVRGTGEAAIFGCESEPVAEVVRAVVVKLGFQGIVVNGDASITSKSLTEH